jgi:mono/diheme cytochrome c family protein
MPLPRHSLLTSALAWLVPLMLVAAEAPTPDLAGYTRQIAPLLARYCVDCHGADAPEAGLALHNIDPNLLGGKDFETWRIVDDQLHFGDMPPRDAPQPTAAERKTLLAWLRGELAKTQLPGVVTEEKLLLPMYGNYVDHASLFDHRRSHVTPAPPRLWRLRPEIYNTVVPRLGERISGLSNALNSADGSEFKDYSAPYFLDEASTQQLFANAKKVAEALVSPQSRDQAFKQLVTDEPPEEKTVISAIETAFRKALGRGPRPDEQQRFLALHQKSTEIGGHQAAAGALLTAVLMQPEFMFRHELGDGQPDEHGRVRLSPSETAYALSYALADLPLQEFTTAAAKGELTTREQVAALVRERLQDSSHNYDKNPRLVQFFREYFHYPFADEVFKDTPEGGEHNARMLVADLEFTVKDILKRDEQVLRELLTTRSYYVNTQYGRKETADQLIRRDEQTRKYQTAFSLPLDWKWSVHLQPVEFRADERAGVLTHPAWLAAWSGNFENHPVQRGKWIRTHLLGGTVPDVPIGVDARVPEAEHKTFRERLKMATGASECWRCHQKMDPLGVVFERYDHYGRYQRLDAGQPVDAAGAITRTDPIRLVRMVKKLVS